MRARTAATVLATAALAVGAIGGVVLAIPVGVAAVGVVRPAPAVEEAAPGSSPPPASHAATVVAASPAPSDSSAAYRGPLIAPTGFRVRTRAELHRWIRSPDGLPEGDPSGVWEQQAWLDIGCMARKGFLYDPITTAEHGGDAPGLTPAQARAYRDAMRGPETGAPYDWRTAGCHGRSVHLTGQDDAH